MLLNNKLYESIFILLIRASYCFANCGSLRARGPSSMSILQPKERPQPTKDNPEVPHKIRFTLSNFLIIDKLLTHNPTNSVLTLARFL